VRHDVSLHDLTETVEQYLAVSSCDGKATFNNFRLAEKVAKRHRRYNHRLQPYKCPSCNKYHIGNSPLHKRKRLMDI